MILMNFDHCSVFLQDNLLKQETENNHWGPDLENKVDDEAIRILNYEQQKKQDVMYVLKHYHDEV